MKKLQLKATILSIALFGAIFLLGCAGQYDKIHTDAAIKSVEARTAFDMDCEEVSLQRLGEITYIPGDGTLASMNIGVKGCNKKAVYFAECVLVSGWGEGKSNCTPRVNTITEVRTTGEAIEENNSQEDEQ